jgi:hypothetical protein
VPSGIRKYLMKGQEGHQFKSGQWGSSFMSGKLKREDVQTINKELS